MTSMAGDLNVIWIHGSTDCGHTTDPPIQVHRFDSDTFILRQSKCSEPGTPASLGPSFEAPFLYLLFGDSKCLLLDSGASRSPAVFPIASTIDALLTSHAAAAGKPRVPLVVAHSHSHKDHVEGDTQLRALPDTTVVPLGVAGVQTFFGIARWPKDAATFDLGGRMLDILPIPGHEESHIAVYDRRTGSLLTGDTLYPGLLVVDNWAAYGRSAQRLGAFARANTVALVLGAHIEMTNRPGSWFGLGALFQPGEHVLQLESRHLDEWVSAVAALGSHPHVDRHDDFIIFPDTEPFPSLDPP
jgi:glyoxylase-like metal-dependent hydrolase (beta-lactamase superfamily II)